MSPPTGRCTRIPERPPPGLCGVRRDQNVVASRRQGRDLLALEVNVLGQDAGAGH